MDTISEKHIQNSKSQIMMILILCVATLLFAIFAMGWGSSSNLDLFTTMKILFGMESADELQSLMRAIVTFYFSHHGFLGEHMCGP